MKVNIMFLHRDNELSILNDDFVKPTSSFNIIFGRRRVGKTSLVNEYINDKHALYLSCSEMIAHLLYKQLAHLVNQFFENKTKEKCTSFSDLLMLISNCEIQEKTVIVFDDFQNLIKNDKDALKTFYTLWSKILRLKNIQIILLSSLQSNDKNDLNIYSKANNSIVLTSLNFNIIKSILPKLNKNDSMYVYSAFGTNPQYLELYDPKKDFILNIKDNFLSYDSFIYND